jgi:hypothetical protein
MRWRKKNLLAGSKKVAMECYLHGNLVLGRVCPDKEYEVLL